MLEARKCLIPGTALTLRHRSIVGCRGSLEVVLRGTLIKQGFKGTMTNVMDTSTGMGTAAESTSTETTTTESTSTMTKLFLLPTPMAPVGISWSLWRISSVLIRIASNKRRGLLIQ